jgi:hypothetical protein
VSILAKRGRPLPSFQSSSGGRMVFENPRHKRPVRPRSIPA